MIGVDPEHIAFAGAAQRHLDVADAIDAIGGDKGERRVCRNRPLDHVQGEAGLGREGCSLRRMGRRGAGLDRPSRPWAGREPGR